MQLLQYKEYYVGSDAIRDALRLVRFSMEILNCRYNVRSGDFPLTYIHVLIRLMLG